LLSDCGMELVYKKRFPDAFDYYLGERNGQGLLQRMQALETYPPVDGAKLMGSPDSYEIPEKKRAKILVGRPDEGCGAVGTLSKGEWEVAAMYLVFAFRRKKMGNG
uniref:mRNA cap 0 methyltransferase domain-containing protein n=1 Tax=Gongylonema pulchrum TaxID=637853 RepID=A0A183D2Z7_9BILA